MQGLPLTECHVEDWMQYLLLHDIDGYIRKYLQSSFDVAAGKLWYLSWESLRALSRVIRRGDAFKKSPAFQHVRSCIVYDAVSTTCKVVSVTTWCCIEHTSLRHVCVD